ncbi:ferritin-like domain-containing protein [Deinococcus marmoris]|uniref:Twin-arginine translocation pathway signal n=1 Tax=Deinococcus marmoris TaxID=249408 RepID=A0A1U7P0P7_9DEIO|nr:ferritin-like domain-containing protein [Deinococcus marmoris]OLV18741.1 Twin-arginine translocation pathway signal [Deinococcus marmoris]
MTTPDRRSFLKYAGVGTGAMMLGGLHLSAFAADTSPTTKSAAQDLAILNYALTLEYIEAAFYAAFDVGGAYASKLSNARVKEYAKELASQEQGHVDYLISTIKSLGGTPVAKPNLTFAPLIPDPSKLNDEVFLQLAVTFEPVGTRAYLGQATSIMNADVLTAAASVLAVEANHVSGIQQLRVFLGYNKKPTRMFARTPQSDAKPNSTNVGDFDPDFSPMPTALWEPLSMAEVLEIVAPLIVK